MANISFRLEFVRALVLQIDIIESDHCLLMVDFNFVDRRSPRFFIFESMWVEHEEYHSVVRDGWSLEGGVGACDKVHEVDTRLNNCRIFLSQWSKEAFSNNKKEIDRLMRELSVINEGGMTTEKALEVDKLKVEVERFWELEEK